MPEDAHTHIHTLASSCIVCFLQSFLLVLVLTSVANSTEKVNGNQCDWCVWVSGGLGEESEEPSLGK